MRFFVLASLIAGVIFIAGGFFIRLALAYIVIRRAHKIQPPTLWFTGRFQFFQTVRK